MTVPLPNISPSQNVTIKEGLEASLQDLQRPGGHKADLTPPTKRASVPKIPQVATNALSNSKEERKFRREKKKKPESSSKSKKKKRLSTKKKSRKDKAATPTTSKPPFYPTPRPDQQKEYTYILNHTELVSIEPEAPEPIFWNKEVLKLKILGDRRSNVGSKNKGRRRKTVRPVSLKTKSERVTEEDVKNNLKSVTFRRQPLGEEFGMRYQTIEDTDSSNYLIAGSKKEGLDKEDYIKSKRTFPSFGSSVGRAKTRNSILGWGDDHSSIIKKDKYPSIVGKNRRMTPTYGETYKQGQNRRSSYFEQEDRNDAAAFHERRPDTKRYLSRGSTKFMGFRQESPRIVGLQWESPKIGGFQRHIPKTIGFQADPDHIEYGFVPSPASRSSLESSGKTKEFGLKSKKRVQNSRIRNLDSTKAYKPRRTSKRKTHEKVVSLGQPNMVGDMSKSNDMKLLDYYRSEYSLEGGKATSSYKPNASEKPIKWKSKKFYNTRPRQEDPSNNGVFSSSLDEGHFLKGFNSIKTVKPTTRRLSYYDPVRTSPIHVDKFVSHSSTGEGVEENVYIVYPDQTFPDATDFVFPDTPSMRTGRTSSKVCL